MDLRIAFLRCLRTPGYWQDIKSERGGKQAVSSRSLSREIVAAWHWQCPVLAQHRYCRMAMTDYRHPPGRPAPATLIASSSRGGALSAHDSAAFSALRKEEK